jgi:membrane protease YdiL (CAAX protease family)
MGSLIAFFLITFAIAWACFIPVAANLIPYHSPQGGAVILIGVFAPSISALLLTARAEGRRGVRELVSGIGRWRVAGRWYVFAATYVIVVKLIVAVVHRVISGTWHFGTLPLYVIPFAIAISTPVQAGEELGWRGYALPRMALGMGLGPASVLLGVIWALWHLPLFFLRDADTYGQSFFHYTLQVAALSVTLAWLYAKTGRSLLLCMLLHAAVNNSKDIVPSVTPGAMNTFTLRASLVAWLTVAVLWVFAILFLARMPALEPRRPERSP